MNKLRYALLALLLGAAVTHASEHMVLVGWAGNRPLYMSQRQVEQVVAQATRPVETSAAARAVAAPTTTYFRNGMRVTVWLNGPPLRTPSGAVVYRQTGHL